MLIGIESRDTVCVGDSDDCGREVVIFGLKPCNSLPVTLSRIVDKKRNRNHKYQWLDSLLIISVNAANKSFLNVFCWVIPRYSNEVSSVDGPIV